MLRKEHTLKHLLAAALAACTVSMAMAAPVVVEFSGTVAYRDGYFSQVPLGSTFSGRIGIDVALTTPDPTGNQEAAFSLVACGYGDAATDATCVGARPLDRSALTLLSVRTDFGAQYARATPGDQPYAEGVVLLAERTDPSGAPPDGADVYGISIAQGTGPGRFGRALQLGFEGAMGWLRDPIDATQLPDFTTSEQGYFVVQESVWPAGADVPSYHSWLGMLNCVRILGDGPARCDVPDVAQVPEPAVWAMVGVGLLALRATHRTRVRRGLQHAGTA